MFTSTTNNKIYRISAWYDLLVTWPFATPITFALLWEFLLTPLNAALGSPPLLEPSIHAILFANFFGSVVVVWALARLYLNDTRLAIFDAAGRLFFSIAMINALMEGISPIVWGLLISEITFCLLQFLALPQLIASRVGNR